ncbi:MAG: tRNA (N6-isopentenyl adenosine(37)-C2)-methylthiotransferase MiaB [Oligoflexia bacterium]|nr:tRNA (N6-isopentenyl adenosine(37)-C2)-methylthiotransferase MiaB [Oligoflexia bacterium]
MTEKNQNSGHGDRVYITTYGCQMNDHDTERMYSLLEMNKYLQATSPEEADVIIINSCSVREKPVHKVMSEVGTYRPLKEKNPKLKIGIGGCVGQQEGKKLLSQTKLLDFVFGTDTIDQLPQIISEVRVDKKRAAWTKVGHRDAYQIQTLVRNPKVSAFVTITKGCDNFCSFCVVPFTRGREKSRLLSELIKDVQSLVERGVKEVTLLGQNVNSYKSPDGNGGFTDLLRAVCEETNIERVRFTTSHPKDFDEDLISVLVKYQNKLGHFVHLPVQSGSTRILELMNRGYTREEYIHKAKRLKEELPEVAFSTDIIVGFPGETDEDFDMTLSMLEEIGYENVYGFKYSPRPFTKALKFTEQVAESVKEERLAKLIELQDRLGFDFCKRYDGKIFPILVEGPSRTNKEVLTGRTTHNKVINFEGPSSLIGKTIDVRVLKAQPFSLRGEVV